MNPDQQEMSNEVQVIPARIRKRRREVSSGDESNHNSKLPSKEFEDSSSSGSTWEDTNTPSSMYYNTSDLGSDEQIDESSSDDSATKVERVFRLLEWGGHLSFSRCNWGAFCKSSKLRLDQMRKRPKKRNMVPCSIVNLDEIDSMEEPRLQERYSYIRSWLADPDNSILSYTKTQPTSDSDMS